MVRGVVVGVRAQRGVHVRMAQLLDADGHQPPADIASPEALFSLGLLVRMEFKHCYLHFSIFLFFFFCYSSFL